MVAGYCWNCKKLAKLYEIMFEGKRRKVCEQCVERFKSLRR